MYVNELLFGHEKGETPTAKTDVYKTIFSFGLSPWLHFLHRTCASKHRIKIQVKPESTVMPSKPIGKRLEKAVVKENKKVSINHAEI